MSKGQREDLITTQGHTMTWKRYHRYGGKIMLQDIFYVVLNSDLTYIRLILI